MSIWGKVTGFFGGKKNAEERAQSAMLARHIQALKAIPDGITVEAGWFESARYMKGARWAVMARRASKAGKKDLAKHYRAKAKAEGDMAGVPVAYIARIQEFGARVKRGKSTIIIPARPFMRGAWSRFQQQRSAIQKNIAGKMAEGKIEPEQALAQIGMAMEGCIVESIKKGGWVANAPSTERKKGFNKPLIDTAQMWQSVSSKVTKRE